MHTAYSPAQMTGIINAALNILRRQGPEICRQWTEMLYREMTHGEALITPTGKEEIAGVDALYALADRCHRCQGCEMAKEPWVIAHLPKPDESSGVVLPFRR